MTRDMLVSLLADALDSKFCQGPVVLHKDDGKTHKSTFMFQCKTVPDITVKKYFQQLAKYTGLSGEAMILAMIHIARIYQKLPNFPVNILTIHRLLLVSVMVSAKFFDDSFLNNARYAHVGGVDGDDLNMLELEYLFLIDFNLYVSYEDYANIFCTLVIDNTALKKIFEVPIPSTPPAQCAVAKEQVEKGKGKPPAHAQSTPVCAVTAPAAVAAAAAASGR